MILMMMMAKEDQIFASNSKDHLNTFAAKIDYQ